MSPAVAYEQFGRWVAEQLRSPWMGDLDGSRCQNKMHEIGILSLEKYSEDKHGEIVGDDDFEEGDDVYFWQLYT
jgi:hypothetical protein